MSSLNYGSTDATPAISRPVNQRSHSGYSSIIEYGPQNPSSSEDTTSESSESTESNPPTPINILPTSENSPLLPVQPKPHHHDHHASDSEPPTSFTYRYEAKKIITYSAPTTLTLILQYSLTTSSIFVVGHLGKHELGAVSLANMTACITGYAVYQGLSTSLDTLCPQAFGCERYKLVGLHTQRVTLLLLLLTIPIGIFWLLAESIFAKILPSEDVETARLAGLYLRIILFGAPGYACFEAGKRFVQAQGRFHVAMYVLIVCAPLNAVMSWVLVWKLNWGFIGAPIAVAITNNLLPLFLVIYILLTPNINRPSCWPKPSMEILRNWAPMLKLAIPGLINIEAEFLAWEILTLVSSYLGSTALAAQSALYSVVCITYQVSFSASVGSSTRIAVLVGAGRTNRAVVAAKVAMCIAVCMGLINLSVLLTFRSGIPHLFTADKGVISLMKALIPLGASLQVFDAVNCSCNGILRAVGRPEIGSYIQLAFYYAFALPMGLWLSFWMDWGLKGVWVGMVVGMLCIAAVELGVILRVDWERAVLEAEERNLLED